MMRRLLLYCSLCLCIALTGRAQWVTRNHRETQHDGKLFIRTSPLSLTDILDENLSYGGEYRFNETWAVTMDAGWIFFSRFFENSQRANGIILRPAVRAYVGWNKDCFIDVQLHYKDVMYHINDWIGREVVNNVPAYEQKTSFRYRKQVTGFHLMYGTKKYISHNGRWYIEAYLGFGVHFRKEYPFHEPNSLYRLQNRTINPSDGTSAWPAFPCGIRLGYSLR